MNASMNAIKHKYEACRKALIYFDDAEWIGMGTGSTVECLLSLLIETPLRNRKYVVSSKRTEDAMRALGFPHLYHPNQVQALDVYIDGADWIDAQGMAIKGYGGALFQEKWLAQMSQQRIAIAETRKWVSSLCEAEGPLPLEVIPSAQSYVARRVLKLGFEARYREGALSDQGNVFLDLHGRIIDPMATERELKSILGVVESGLFALQPFQKICLGGP